MTPLFENLGIALLLGLLVGLQREHVTAELAGLRTFPMITVLGTVSAYLDGLVEGSGWVIAAGMLSVVVLVIAEKLRQPPKEKPGGITTEISIVLMFAVGALLVLGYRTGGVAVGVGVAALLQFKPELHGLAARLGDNDLRAIMQFGVITFVILPVLPNRTFGPLDVFNPFQTWLMVSLIVGISLGGYVAYKFFGDGSVESSSIDRVVGAAQAVIRDETASCQPLGQSVAESGAEGRIRQPEERRLREAHVPNELRHDRKAFLVLRWLSGEDVGIVREDAVDGDA